jgi:lysophospholipase L1-like esterase
MAARQKVPLLDLFSLFQKQPRWEELIFNGSSPNRAGSRFIAKELAHFLPSTLKKCRRGARSGNWITIVAHGDSVTNSIGVKGVDRHGLTWRRILERRLRKAGHSVLVRNSGIPCDRVVIAAERFQADVLARQPQFVLICFGLNDAWITDAQKPILPVRCYGEKLREMVRAAKRNGVTPILLSPNPMTLVYYTNYFQRPVYMEKGVNCQLEVLIDEMARVAKTEGVDFIDMFQQFRGHAKWHRKYSPLLEDGLHPGRAGNRFWAAILADYLKGKLSSARP